MKIEVWLETGNGRTEQVVDTNDLGYDDAAWAALDPEMQEELMREIAFGPVDWGWHPLLEEPTA